MNEQYLTASKEPANLCAFSKSVNRMSGTPKASGESVAPEPISREIKDILNRSMSAWNAGDLAGFLGCYENSPTTCYLSADQIVVGYQAIEAMYAERFAIGGAAARGMLSLSLTRVQALGPEHSLAIGQYLLSRDGHHGGSGYGVFSLVLRRTALGWRIAADHTTSV
jgi:uncharacterized protein (TIGR02246 family)